MAKLYFHYSAMNAGKSTHLLQTAHNYEERGMNVLCFTAAIDTRFGEGKISSRLGIERDALLYRSDTNLKDIVREYRKKHEGIQCILLDEAQFLSEEQVNQLSDIVDEFCIHVHCYGLRSDFRGVAFPGSAQLLVMADELIEYRTRCWCGAKAIMNLRMNGDEVAKDGDQIQVGDAEYTSLCRKHWKAMMR